jgi:2-methylcitrate dehydratase PrpD
LVTGQGVLEQLATTLVYPQALPFNAPLDQIRVLLDKLGCSYGQVLSAWSAAASTVAAQTLGLSADQQRIVTTALTVAAEIAPYYNVSDISTLSVADTFMASTWMNYAQMLTLLGRTYPRRNSRRACRLTFSLTRGWAANGSR